MGSTFFQTWNVETQGDQAVINRLPRRAKVANLYLKPSMDEVIDAKAAMKGNKAAGGDGNPPDFVKCLDETNTEELQTISEYCWGDHQNDGEMQLLSPYTKEARNPKRNATTTKELRCFQF